MQRTNSEPNPCSHLTMNWPLLLYILGSPSISASLMPINVAAISAATTVHASCRPRRHHPFTVDRSG
ncbi:hypothetical protein VFPPC_15753 [Pochonia chlamydosporia 170]|uniref:Uncharacterized protein n=1 Tax=Pochonia chlamydosporia 170 TaxID=1380566 RepID=A0A179FRY1_METCM|nr:hypothetical protein VFPPC_15753 [Pochonia chlamydosporia 170]OAQ67960.1 hypothetical protein VFPPC_15753 [Pochonia chlamydosporia 170]